MTALLPRRLVLRLLAAGFGWPPALASAAPLPDRAPPSGFTLVNGTAGGRTLAGTFSGNARSAAVWRSWSLNQQMLRDRMQDAATTMRQTGEILRSAARGQREAFDRASRGFSYYLRGLEVLEHTPSGARGSFDRDYARAVVRADPTKFRLVPPSQYRSGD